MDPNKMDKENVPQEDTNPEKKEDVIVEDDKKEAVEELETQKKEERPIHTIPLSKFNEEKEKAAEKARRQEREAAELEIARIKQEYEEKLQKNQNTSGVEDKVSKWAKDHGYDEQQAKDLVSLVRESVELPDLSKYDKILEQQAVETYRSEVQKRFDDKVLPLMLERHPNVSQEHVERVKQKITELAFTEGYNTYRVEDIYKIHADSEFAFKDSLPAESHSGHNGKMVDFQTLSDEEEIELADRDPEMYARYINWQKRNSSRFSF